LSSFLFNLCHLANGTTDSTSWRVMTIEPAPMLTVRRGVHPPKSMMHIAYSPISQKNYKAKFLNSPLFSFNLCFWLNLRFSSSPSPISNMMHLCIYMYWTPVTVCHHSIKLPPATTVKVNGVLNQRVVL